MRPEFASSLTGSESGQFLSNSLTLVNKVRFTDVLYPEGLIIVITRDVNETLRPETETFHFQSETRPRPRPSHFSRDRDRDRDVRFSVRDETETETLIGRDRDIFQDLGMLSYI